MLIVPIGRENATLQRHAWLTYSIIAINIVMYLIVATGDAGRDRAGLLHSWRSTIEYVRDRPYLRIPIDITELMPPSLRQRQPVPDPTVPEWKSALEQKELDGMSTELRDRYDASRDIQLAFVPAVPSVLAIFTSMFLHAGIPHLIGNMFFLFATAPFVEDVFGRPLFAFLYLSGGAIATVAFAARYRDSIIPLVGASGAIAAVMGAYLIRFATARIQFVVLPFASLRFSIPALVVLSLWFLEQIVSIPMEGDSGVAVTTHVAGFAYGMVFAAVIKAARIEDRFIRPHIEKRIAWHADSRLETAMAALIRRDVETARRQVLSLLGAEPDNPDALRLAVDIALSRHDLPGIDAFGTRLLSYYAAHDRPAALALIEELTVTNDPLPQFIARAAAQADRWGDRKRAVALYERLTALQSDSADAVPLLVKLANAQRSSGDAFAARLTLMTAREHPACSSEWRRKIDNTIALLSSH